MSFKALQKMEHNNITAVALSAHKSHCTQVLDYSGFSPFKKNFLKFLNRLAMQIDTQVRHDVYALSDILHRSCKASLTYASIVNGYKECGVWCLV